MTSSVWLGLTPLTFRRLTLLISADNVSRSSIGTTLSVGDVSVTHFSLSVGDVPGAPHSLRVGDARVLGTLTFTKCW